MKWNGDICLIKTDDAVNYKTEFRSTEFVKKKKKMVSRQGLDGFIAAKATHPNALRNKNDSKHYSALKKG